jgi:hypothetical protein
MAKPRKPRAPTPAKKKTKAKRAHVVSARISDEARAQLAANAKAHGNTISREAELLLLRALQTPATAPVAEAFFVLVAMAVTGVRRWNNKTNQADRSATWLNDAELHYQTRRIVEAALNYVAVPGWQDAAESADANNLNHPDRGCLHLASVWDAVRVADLKEEPATASRRKHQAIRRDLHGIEDRPTIFGLTGPQARAVRVKLSAAEQKELFALTRRQNVGLTPEETTRLIALLARAPTSHKGSQS